MMSASLQVGPRRGKGASPHRHVAWPDELRPRAASRGHRHLARCGGDLPGRAAGTAADRDRGGDRGRGEPAQRRPAGGRGVLSVATGGEGTGGALYVAARYDAIGHVRNLLFELATPRDYALYDPQLNWLIDPTDRIDVTVTHGGAGEFPYLTERLAHQWITELGEPNPYLIVERADHVYIQTYRDEPGLYTLEYRDGGPDRHFAVRLEDGQQVAALVWDWTTGDRSRLDAIGWEAVTF